MKRASLTQRDYLAHMLDAVMQVETYTSGKTHAEFLTDRFLQDAVIRNMEVLARRQTICCDSFR